MRAGPLPGVAARQLWSRSHSGVVRMVSALSVAGIAIGAAALVLLDSFMNGFQGSIADCLSLSNPPVLVTSPAGGVLSDADLALLDDLSGGLEGLSGVSPFVEKPVVAAGNGGNVTGVVMRAVDPSLESGVSRVALGMPSDGPSAVLGTVLARRLSVQEGDSIRVASTEGVEMTATGRALVDTILSLRVEAVRDFGLSEYNSDLMVTNLGVASVLFPGRPEYTGAGIGVDEGGDPAALAEELSSILKEEYVGARHDRYLVAESFMSRHANLFRAFGLERFAMTVVLALITVVALLNLSSALSMIALEHRRDLGVLRAMGAGPSDLVRSALLQGLLLGGAGCVLGGILSGLIILASGRLFRIGLEGSVYWVDTLTARVDPAHIAAVMAFIMASCLAASIVPAAGAVSIPPGECVRHE